MSLGSAAGTDSQEGSEDGEAEEVKKGLNYFIGNKHEPRCEKTGLRGF